jgi:hypothetical protein
MDAELNTNVGLFGANLVGYPHIKEGGGNYNGAFNIINESPKTNYQHMPTDDLSHIWATNYRDNIDDLDAQLREANINSFDPAYYGAKNLNFIAPATADMWDFGKYLEPQDKVDGLNNLHNPDLHNPDLYNSNSLSESEYLLEKNMCYPLWLILLAIAIAIFGGYMLFQSKTNNDVNSQLMSQLNKSVSKSANEPAK